MSLCRLVIAVLILSSLPCVKSQASATDGDDQFESNNDMMSQRDVTFDELTSAAIPRFTATQRYTPSSQAKFGVAATIPPGTKASTIPPFLNTFTPMQMHKTDLLKWGFKLNQAPWTVLTHVVVTAQVFLDDYTRSTAWNLGKDPGASAEASAVVGYAATNIIGQQLLTEIGTACASCDASPIAQKWNAAASKVISELDDGLVFIGDITSSTNRRGVVGHTFTFNVSISTNAVDVISNGRFSSPLDVAGIVATAFSRPNLVQTAFRAAAGAVLKFGYLDFNSKRKRSTARITSVIKQASVMSTGIASKVYGIVRTPVNTAAAASEANDEQRRNLHVVNVDLLPEGDNGAITLPLQGRNLKPGVKALREAKNADPIVH